MTTFENEDREDLLTRLQAAHAFMSFVLTHGLDAVTRHGIDFRKLPEWQERTLLDRARKLRPSAARPVIIEFFSRLESGLHAAIRRKGMTIVR